MILNWFSRVLSSRSRPAPRRRPARARLGLEHLETRLVPTVFTGLSAGQLSVSSDNLDDVSIDHSGATTFVNQKAFADASITQGIHILSGFVHVNILATVKPVTADEEAQFNIGKA